MPDNLPIPEPLSRPWALFLDLDGTLLEIADRPENVKVPDNLGPLLQETSDLLNHALAVVSGRSLGNLEAILPPCRMDLVGCHGAESRVNGVRSALPVSRMTSMVAERLAARASAITGAFIEVKSHAVAFHYRSATISSAAAKNIAEDAIRDLSPDLRIIAGKAVVEIVPKGVGKGAAVTHLLAQGTYFGRLPVFVGDDTTDEEAFAAVNELGGISIHVGTVLPTCAKFRTPSVTDVMTWLGGPVLRELREYASVRR